VSLLKNARLLPTASRGYKLGRRGDARGAYRVFRFRWSSLVSSVALCGPSVTSIITTCQHVVLPASVVHVILILQELQSPSRNPTRWILDLI